MKFGASIAYQLRSAMGADRLCIKGQGFGKSRTHGKFEGIRSSRGQIFCVHEGFMIYASVNNACPAADGTFVQHLPLSRFVSRKPAAVKWDFIWKRQRFLLHHPLLHEDSIKSAFGREVISEQTKIIQILSAILPTLAIANQKEVSRTLGDLSRQ